METPFSTSDPARDPARDPAGDPARQAALARALAALPVAALAVRTDEALDNGPHHHPAGQVMSSQSGLMTVILPAQSLIVPANQCVWIPPGTIHAVRAHGAFSGWGAFLAPAACALLPPEPRVWRSSALLREAVERLAALGPGLAAGATPRNHHQRQRNLGAVILDELCDLRDEPLTLPTPENPRLRRITEALSRDPGDRRPHTDWARLAAVSPRTLTRLFRAETGISFSEWRQRARAFRACELLEQGVAIGTIARELGYDSAGSFIAAFRQSFGTTPGDYARRRDGAL
ncbi:AraC family transcriptional regulator [Paracoccus aminophilus]|uniref:Transcriptional regulator, AraC family n=1 Tax=Paracoccus aminophilus JCM 7686 TaxID=1367847 RepID=S5YZX2_PARAH|nr:helix-turn-helix transcriptional regulator [Paracoccus aminophilus]AGT10756.1 transcriptional regulator, AraC family [Paracoccus aminophilus JCM 7686]